MALAPKRFFSQFNAYRPKTRTATPTSTRWVQKQSPRKLIDQPLFSVKRSMSRACVPPRSPVRCTVVQNDRNFDAATLLSLAQDNIVRAENAQDSSVTLVEQLKLREEAITLRVVNVRPYSGLRSVSGKQGAVQKYLLSLCAVVCSAASRCP